MKGIHRLIFRICKTFSDYGETCRYHFFCCCYFCLWLIVYQWWQVPFLAIHRTYFLILSQFHLQKWYIQLGILQSGPLFCQLQWVPLISISSPPQHAHKLTLPWNLAPYNKVPTTVKTRTYSQLHQGPSLCTSVPRASTAQPSPNRRTCILHTEDIPGAPDSGNSGTALLGPTIMV